MNQAIIGVLGYYFRGFLRTSTRSPQDSIPNYPAFSVGHTALLCTWSHTDNDMSHPLPFRWSQGRYRIFTRDFQCLTADPFNFATLSFRTLSARNGFCLRTGDQYGGYHEVRPHGYKKVETVARKRERKIKKKTNFSTGTFRDTASAAPRERENSVFGPCRPPPLYKSLVTCLGPSSPPTATSSTTTTSFSSSSSSRHFKKRCTSLLFSYFSASSLFLPPLSPSVFFAHFVTFCLFPTPMIVYLFLSLLISVSLSLSLCIYVSQSKFVERNIAAFDAFSFWV